MSTLDSDSTDTEVWAAYDDNASYLEDASVVKARAFITACTFLMRRLPVRAGHGDANIEHAIHQIQGEKKDAQRYVSSRAGVASGGAGVKYKDISDLR